MNYCWPRIVLLAQLNIRSQVAANRCLLLAMRCRDKRWLSAAMYERTIKMFEVHSWGRCSALAHTHTHAVLHSHSQAEEHILRPTLSNDVTSRQIFNWTLFNHFINATLSMQTNNWHWRHIPNAYQRQPKMMEYRTMCSYMFKIAKVRTPPAHIRCCIQQAQTRTFIPFSQMSLR